MYICILTFTFAPFRIYILLSNNLPPWPLPANQHICYLLSRANRYTLFWWNRFVTIFYNVSTSYKLFSEVVTDVFFSS